MEIGAIVVMPGGSLQALVSTAHITEVEGSEEPYQMLRGSVIAANPSTGGQFCFCFCSGNLHCTPCHSIVAKTIFPVVAPLVVPSPELAKDMRTRS